MGRPCVDPVKRFFSHVQKGAGCWEWLGTVSHEGYGMFRPGGMATCIPAHRWAFAHYSGEFVPKGKVVMHKCDNRRCVRKSHIVLGTIRDNNDDRHNKGRTLRGEQHSQAKLKERSVRSIKRRLAAGAALTPLSKQYSVSVSLLSMIRSGKRWSHVQ